MTETEAAKKMGMPLNRLSEIVNGKRGISADTALKLSRLFRTTPQFWMNLQANVDLYRARQRQLATTSV
jgi:addiction module HigA family antidote